VSTDLLSVLSASVAVLTLCVVLRWRGTLTARGRARRRLTDQAPIGEARPPLPVPLARALTRLRRSKALERMERSLPAALEGMARSMRSGASLRQAIEEASRTVPGPLGQELRRVGDEVKAGTPLALALDSLAAGSPLSGVRLAVAALGLGNEWGGGAARGLDAVAATLRERLGVADEIHALGAHARMSALVISLAPLGFGAFAAATDPRIAAFLLGTPLGVAFVVSGLTLDMAGWVWMHRLSRGPR
jgi:tight adherence protein B